MRLKLPAIFNSNMVFQRQKPIAVWGWSMPEAKVTVEFLGSRVSATADSCGKWNLTLPSCEAGGPHTLSINSGEENITLENILVGEVWLCSGQSNMGFSLSQADSAEEDIPRADFPGIRYINICRNTSMTPQDDCVGDWRVVTPETAGAQSAVAYYFARKLHQDLSIPVGIIHSSWGGSMIASWLNTEALEGKKQFAPILDRDAKLETSYHMKAEKYAESVRKFIAENQAAIVGDDIQTGINEGWHKSEYDDNNWETTDKPFAKIPKFEIPKDGAVWFRKEIEIPNAWTGKDIELNLGVIDAQKKVFFNGEEIESVAWDVPFFFLKPTVSKIPARLVNAGKAIVAVRTLYKYCAGSANAYRNDRVYLANNPDKEIKIDGSWKYKVEARYEYDDDSKYTYARPATFPQTPWSFQRARVLFNAMINPLIPYTIRGFLWYQGESDAGQARNYIELQKSLIEIWRKLWNDSGLYFGIVQLANWQEVKEQPGEDEWAELREAQFVVHKEIPKTGIATAIDIGESNDIHPRNKKDLGNRLARWALNDAYGIQTIWSGPQFAGTRIVGDKIEVRFSEFGDGLQTSDGGAPKGFALASGDGDYIWADAEITAPDTITLSSGKCPAPEFVRYAWARNPVTNLSNSEGLPAFPFRTDSREGLTYNNF